mgnify:CR=1 FL=1
MKSLVFVCETVAFGVGKHFIDLVSGLSVDERFDIHVIISSRRSNDAFIGLLQRLDINLHFQEMERDISWRDFTSLLAIFRVVRSVGSRSDQLLIGVSSKGGALVRILALLFGYYAVYIPHASPVSMASGFKLFIYTAIERVLSLRSFYAVATSAMEFSTVEKFISRRKITLIQNGLSKSDIKLLQNRRADHSIGETVRLAFIGRLDDQKNPIRALMVTHSLSQSIEVELTFYGDGPLKNCVEQTAESLGLNISMMGYHPFAEICADFDILLNTSNYEGSPYLFLEAAAINLPVITTKVGGAIELKDRGIPTHLLQENYDFTEIANFIRANTGKGHSCKYTAVQYSSDEMVREYADLFVK